jgi:hypothetical protein
VSLVDQRRDGSWVLRDAIRAAEDRGWTVIPWDVDGPGTSYLRAVGQGAYLSRFETAHAGTSTTTGDEAGYAAWLVELRTRGVLPAFSRWALVRLRERISRDLAAAQDQLHAAPSVRPTLDRLAADLAAVEAELGSAGGDGAGGAVPAIEVAP